MSTNQSTSQPPDGISDEHVEPVTGWQRHASPLSILVFGGVIVLGMAGLLGHERDWRAAANGVELRVHSPEIIRNGEFFEIRVDVESSEPIGALVIGVDASLWEDITVNTMIPAAADEESADGEFRFTFAPLAAGTRFAFKADLQVNPDILGGNEGAITVYDGEELLAATDVSITVLP